VYLDATNLQILHRLARSGRTSIAELATVVGRSESAVRERVAHLEQHGVIHGYGARLDLGRLGLGMRATVRARLDPRRAEEVARRLRSVPEVLEARFVTGRLSLWIDLCAQDMAALEGIIARHIAPLDLEGLEVQVTLQTLVDSRAPDVQALLPERRPLPPAPPLPPQQAPAPVPAAAPAPTPVVQVTPSVTPSP
jgi:Lrp/AsnC family leucine-responsive transcriptional regulator